MCGINGFSWNDSGLVNSMNSSIKHRGPDDQGSYSDELASLGHVRLSIIDLSPAGHQPMFYSKAKGASSEKHNKKNMKYCNASVVFNGEIYNFLDLKTELEKKGYFFSTKSDTEVILASYLEWGTDCVRKFNGMWAFVIYDLKKKILFCSRDRLGVKPFFYYHDQDGRFIFSSELKGILSHKELDINNRKNVLSESINLYFSLGFIPSPSSIFRNTYKLEPRQNLIFDLRKKTVKKSDYYDIPKYAPLRDRKKLVSEGRRLLEDATRMRLIADVPVGAFLSGGLDSSAVVGEMSKIIDSKNFHTISIGFEGKYDETKYINIVKDYYKTKHHHHYFKKKDFESLISKFPIIYDEPFWDYSGFPTYVLSKNARKYVTVALSGDGGDEVFGGYFTHVTGYRMDLIRKFPRIFRQIGSKISAKKNLNTYASLYLLKEACKVSLFEPKDFLSRGLEDEMIKTAEYKKWASEKLEFCLKKGDGKLGEALRIYDILFGTLPDNFLVKVDRASMQQPLEVRSPFLDYRFVEFSQRIPTEWKQNATKTKILMREIIKGLVPDEIINRGKRGFTPPIDKWILQDKYTKMLGKDCDIIEDIAPEVAKFYKEKVFAEKNEIYNMYRIRLFLFGLWWRKWVKD